MQPPLRPRCNFPACTNATYRLENADKTIDVGLSWSAGKVATHKAMTEINFGSAGKWLIDKRHGYVGSGQFGRAFYGQNATDLSKTGIVKVAQEPDAKVGSFTTDLGGAATGEV